LPAWSRNLTSKVTHRPKLFVTDSGLAADLVGVDETGMTVTGGPVGQLTETFVAMELRKQIAWAEARPSLYHFRDRGGAEIDLILELPDGRVAGIEVKASSTVSRRDFRVLRLLHDRLGEQFIGGVVLHRGPEAVSFGDRLAALPIETLWRVS
jgi:predicted AAA+ superfamily ATPase